MCVIWCVCVCRLNRAPRALVPFQGLRQGAWGLSFHQWRRNLRSFVGAHWCTHRGPQLPMCMGFHMSFLFFHFFTFSCHWVLIVMRILFIGYGSLQYCMSYLEHPRTKSFRMILYQGIIPTFKSLGPHHWSKFPQRWCISKGQVSIQIFSGPAWCPCCKLVVPLVVELVRWL